MTLLHSQADPYPPVIGSQLFTSSPNSSAQLAIQRSISPLVQRMVQIGSLKGIEAARDDTVSRLIAFACALTLSRTCPQFPLHKGVAKKLITTPHHWSATIAAQLFQSTIREFLAH